MTSELLPVDLQATGVVERVVDPVVDPVAVERPSVAAPPPSATEVLSCPECGTTASVTLNRRDATDFCRSCDYPLFWTPSRVYYDRSADAADEALRRLPGTVGRATLAALPCPHCAEPNALSAQTCVRCGLSMHPVEPPPPVPVYVPPPPPPVAYVEPEHRVAWWVWALLGFGAVVVVTLIILILTHVIG